MSKALDDRRPNFYTCIMDKKETTIDDLAAMIKHGFDQMVTKDELHDYVDRRIDEVKQIQEDILEELNATHVDVSYIRNTLSPLVRNDVAQDESIEDLDARVGNLEQKAKFA